MADIELVIKIPEEKIVIEYGEVVSIGRNNDKELADYIFAGTPLEKHDAKIIKETVESIWGKPPYTEVLDKIRAEIEHCKNKYYMSDDGKILIAYQNDTIEQVLRIIDKYRKGQTNADSD